MTVMLGTSTAIIDLDIGGLMGKASQAQGALDKLGASSGKGLDSFSSKVKNVSGSIDVVGKSMLGFGAVIGAGFGFAVKSATSFEAQMSAVGSVTGATGKDLDVLRTEALRLGKDTAFSATESAQAMEIMAKAGVSVGDISNGATQDILDLANAAGVDVPHAAETAATAMNVFGVSSKDAADIISRSANVSSLDVNDWALALKSAGPVAAALGIPMQDVAAGMIILGDAGIKGEVGATALRNIMLNLADTSSDGSVALAEVGISAYDANGQFRGLEAITHDLAGTWGDLTQEQKLSLAQTVAGKDGAAAFTTIMDAQTESVKKGSDAFEDSKTRMSGVGDAATQAAQRMDNFKGAFEQFKGSLETVGITIGSLLLPALKSIVEVGTSALNFFLTLPSGIQTAIAAVTGIVGALALAGGAFLLILPRIVAFQEALAALKTAELFGGAAAEGGAIAEGGMFAGLGAAIPIILAVAAALGVLYLAYKTNFLGFGDGVRAVGSKVKGVFNDVTGGIKKFGDALTGTSPKVDQLNKTQRAWVDGMRAGGATQEQINGYLRAQGVSAEYAQKKYDNLNKTQRAWVDGLRAGGATQEQIDGYLRAQGVSAEYTTSKYDYLRNSMNPLAARTQLLGDAFKAIGWDTAAHGVNTLGGFIQAFTDQYDQLGHTMNPVSRILSSTSSAFEVLGRMIPGLAGPLTTISNGFDSASKAVQRFTTGFTLGRTLGLSPFRSALLGLSTAFPILTPAINVVTGAMDTLGNVFDKVTGKLGDLKDSYDDARKNGMDPFHAAGQALMDQFPTLRKAVEGVQVGFDALLHGDWNTLGNVAQSALNNIMDALRPIGSALGGMAVSVGNWVLDVGVPTVTGWLSDHAGDIWGAVKDAAGWVGTMAGNLLSWTLDVAVPAISGWLKDHAGDAWEAVKSLAGWTGNMLGDISGWVLNVGIPALTGWLSEHAGDIWSAIKTAAGWAGGVLGDIGSWTLNVAIPALTGWLSDHASDIWNALKSAAGWAGGVLGDLGAWTLDVAIPALTGWLTDHAGDIWSALKSAAGWAGGVLANLGSWTIDVAVPALTGWLSDHAGDVWSALKTAAGWGAGVVGDIAGWVLNVGVPSLTGWLSDHAGDVWSALKSAAGWSGGVVGNIVGWTLDVAIPAVTGWLSDHGGDIWDAVKSIAGWTGNMAGKLASWTLDVAIPAVTGWLADHAGDVWEAVKGLAGWSGSMAGKLAGWTLDIAIPAITGWLSDHSGDIWDAVRSLANWAGSMAGKIVGWTLDVGIPAITGWLSDHKGQIWEAVKDLAGWAGDMAGSLLAWTLDVGAPTVGGWIQVAAGNAWDAIRALAGGLNTMEGKIDAGWLLTVGAPKIDAIFNAAGINLGVQQAIDNAGSVSATLKAWDLIINPPATTSGDPGAGAGQEAEKKVNDQNIIAKLNHWSLEYEKWDSENTLFTNEDIKSGLDTGVAGIGEVKKLFNKWGLDIGPPETMALQAGLNLGQLITDQLALQSVSDDIMATLNSWGDSLFNGFSLPMPDVSGWFSGWSMPSLDSLPGVGLLKTLFQGLGDSFGDFHWPAVSIPMPDIGSWFNWAMPSLDSLPGVGLVKTLLQGLGDLFSDFHWPAISIPSPDISWPDPMDWVPQNVKDFFTLGPMGYVMGHGGGSSEPASASANQPGLLSGHSPGMPFGDINFKINAEDLATPTLNTVKNAIAGIPPSKLTALQQVGGEAVASVSAAALGAINAIPTSRLTALQQVGGEAVASTSGAASLAINAIPALKTSLITQVGGETVSAVSGAASAAINAIPASKFSTIGQVGAETVAALSTTASAAINAIPASKLIALQQVGGEAVVGLSGAASAAINAIPASRLTALQQVGAEAVAGASGAATAAIGSIPDFKMSTIAQVGADAVIGASGAAAGAIGAIPPDHFTGISQAGAEGVAGSSNAAMGAVQAIPTSWFTAITEAGGAGVAGSANTATSAISAIPTSHGTSISEAGSGGVIGAANGVASAVNAIPSSKTVVISVVRSGVVTFAKGGTVPENGLARMAELGPELLRFPSGNMGMAMTDGLYGVPPKTFVYTAAQTKRKLRSWDGPAYADGGYVSRPTPSRVSASSSVSLSGGLLATVNGIVAGVQSTLQSGMQAATSTIQTSTSAWPTIVGAQQGSMTSAGTLAVGGVQPTLQLGMQAATNAIETSATAWPTIVGAQQNPMADAGTMVGTSMSEGAAAGIAGAGWSVSDAAVSVVGDAIAAANAAAGIASPSTEMIPVGEYMDAGLAQGIYNGQSTVVDAAVSVAQAAIDAYASTMKNGWTNVGDGSWQSGSTGVVQKGILAEDGGYVNPNFYSNNSALFEEWKRRFSSGQTTSNWTQYQARGYATGGTVRSDTARMGELGPELLRYPSGTAGMALTDGLYTVPLGTYVYTAAQTKRMMRSWKGPAFANGGRVTRPATPIHRAGGSGTTVIDNSTTTTTVPVQVYPQSTLTAEESRTLYTNVARAITGSTDTVRTSKGVRS